MGISEINAWRKQAIEYRIALERILARGDIDAIAREALFGDEDVIDPLGEWDDRT